MGRGRRRRRGRFVHRGALRRGAGRPLFKIHLKYDASQRNPHTPALAAEAFAAVPRFRRGCHSVNTALAAWAVGCGQGSGHAQHGAWRVGNASAVVLTGLAYLHGVQGAGMAAGYSRQGLVE